MNVQHVCYKDEEADGPRIPHAPSRWQRAVPPFCMFEHVRRDTHRLEDAGRMRVYVCTLRVLRTWSRCMERPAPNLSPVA